MTIDLWPSGTMPGSGASQPEGERPSQGDGVMRLTHVSRPQITLFPAAAAKSPTPAVIVCPGGGYEILAFNKEGSEVAQWLTSIGVTAVLLKYRVPANREGAFADIQRAIRLVRHHSSAWGIDPKRVGVLGFSAGGHLCARLSTNPSATARYPQVDSADLLSDRPDFAVLAYPAYLGKDGVVSPELPVSAAIPPTLIVHAEDDRAYIEGSRIYSAALKAAGAPIEFKSYSTGGHGHGLRASGTVSSWPADCQAWLQSRGIIAR